MCHVDQPKMYININWPVLSWYLIHFVGKKPSIDGSEWICFSFWIDLSLPYAKSRLMFQLQHWFKSLFICIWWTRMISLTSLLMWVKLDWMFFNWTPGLFDRLMVIRRNGWHVSLPLCRNWWKMIESYPRQGPWPIVKWHFQILLFET